MSHPPLPHEASPTVAARRWTRQPRWRAGLSLLMSLGGWVASTHGGIIPATSSAVVDGLSALNWVVKGGSVSATVGGASFALVFPGTRRVTLRLDTSGMEKWMPGRCPVIAWSVDGGLRQTHQLRAAESTVVLAEDRPDPQIDFYLMGFSPFENRYDGDHPVNSVRILGFEVDDGGRAAALPRPRKLWLNIGDSILSGDVAREPAGRGRPADDAWAASDDARASYGYLLARHYDYAESRLAFGGYDYGGGMANVPALPVLLDQITSTVSRLRNGCWPLTPDVVLVNLGENGKPTQGTVMDALSKLRLRAGPAAKIIVMVPLSGRSRTEVTNAVQAYCDTRHDEGVHLIDLGAIRYKTADGQHPTADGHRTVYEAATAAFDALLR